MVRNKWAQVPRRWENYSAVGEKIPNTPFLPCKTPLRRDLCRKLRSPDGWFTVEGLMVAATQKDCRVGTVVDLCDTDRYLEKDVFLRWGVQHVKIYAPGNRLPFENSVRAFFDTVDAFRRRYNDRRTADMTICVMSTHGVNRVGYFICRYLIERLAWGPKSALRFFEDCRGHGMERRALKSIILKLIAPSVGNWKKPTYQYGSLSTGAMEMMESMSCVSIPAAEEADRLPPLDDADPLPYASEEDSYPKLGFQDFVRIAEQTSVDNSEQSKAFAMPFNIPNAEGTFGSEFSGMSGAFSDQPVAQDAAEEQESVEAAQGADAVGGEGVMEVRRRKRRKRKTMSEMYAEFKRSKFHEIHELRNRYFNIG